MTRMVPAVVLLAALCASGCGYSLAGRGSFLPSSIRVIGIPLFSNQTSFFRIEEAFTESVRSEFIGRGKYKILPQATGVDAVLNGTITSVSIVPVGFNQQEQQRASRYAISITARIEFRDVAGNKVLWENPSLVFREEYDIGSSGSAINAQDPTILATTFFGQETEATRRVSTDFARTVVSAILEAF